MKQNNPIGIFDSGIGGLTIAKAISESLPNEKIIYFGDTAHTPWGDKSAQVIKQHTHQICSMLLQFDCKLIVAACNTASAIASSELVAFTQHLPIINVIQPVIDALTESKTSQQIAIIGTKQTIQSQIYSKLLKNTRPDFVVHELSTPMLVPIVEEGLQNNTQIVYPILDHYFSQPEFQRIDTLVLGCTHYPLLKDAIQNYLGKSITIIDAPQQVSNTVFEYLQTHNLTRKNSRLEQHEFMVSDNNPFFTTFAQQIFDKDIKLTTLVNQPIDTFI